MLPKGVRVPAAQQWISNTEGRIATDPFSWLQAVHWVAGAGLYTPRRSHGPAFGTTTLLIAQLLADVTPCRPGVDYLMRRTGLSERTVQYHLEMLREAGLLAYLMKGTRVRGRRALASEFVRVIPVCFDEALGLRIRGTGPERRVVGIAGFGRARIAALGKKAARKVRRPRSKTLRRSARTSSRCTPMGGGTSGSPRTESIGFPSERKLAGGTGSSSRTKKVITPRVLNAVGRRHQLARELVAQVPWLSRASAPRVAWVVRHVADAGWTATEVIAVAEFEAPTRSVRRPSGFLAHRLQGAHLLHPTPEGRAALVARWRDSRQAERTRHSEWGGVWRAPVNGTVAAMVDEALRALGNQDDPEEMPLLDGICDLTADEISNLRTTAHSEYLAGRTTLIEAALSSLGKDDAIRLYGPALVGRALCLANSRPRLRPVVNA
ncbi:transcriptional regulator [Embleya sp. MST-111070]|uniref:transcriptional regulator n=1 Tax=Embleya sp. MST-111070 TaxID=3398231 RepID=UPI003F732C86